MHDAVAIFCSQRDRGLVTSLLRHGPFRVDTSLVHEEVMRLRQPTARAFRKPQMLVQPI